MTVRKTKCMAAEVFPLVAQFLQGNRQAFCAGYGISLSVLSHETAEACLNPVWAIVTATVPSMT